ncbi:MAG: ankyrin repeat domain-containing protein [Rickettsiales bacterium]|jgi:ankyrin repeat protein
MRGFVGLRMAALVGGILVVAGLFCAVGEGQAQQSQLIFEHPFIIAARTGDLATVQDMLARGDSPDVRDKEGQTPLMIATINGNIDIAETIIGVAGKLDAKDNQGNTALGWAAIQNQLDISEMLLNAGASPDIQNRQGMTPLMQAAKAGRYIQVEFMLQRRPDLTLKDYTGRSVLGWARQSRDRRLVSLLENFGARD